MNLETILSIFKEYNIDYIADSVYMDNEGQEFENDDLICEIYDCILAETQEFDCYLNSVYLDIETNQLTAIWENEEGETVRKVFK